MSVAPITRSRLPHDPEPGVARQYALRLCDAHTRRPRVRVEDGGGQCSDDGVEGRRPASRASGDAVHAAIVRALSHVGVEIVHEQAEGGFLRPTIARHRRATRRADWAVEKAHVRLTIAVAGCHTRAARAEG